MSSLILIIFNAAIHGYRSAMSVSASLMDNELKSVLHALALSESKSTGDLKANELAFQIWRGQKLVSHSGLSERLPIARFNDGFSDQNFSGQRWRVFKQAIDGELTIIVAQPLQHRVLLTESLTISAITPFLYAVPLLAIIILLVVTRGLSPLKALSNKLSVRQGKDLSPVTLSSIPTEMMPVMDTLNTMFARLNSAFEREQQFASNAAHELRTPLSVMKINLHNLAESMVDKKDALQNIQKDTDRMIHVVNQILLLSRTSPELFKMQLGNVDVVAIAQKVITDLYGKIEDKQQDISLDGESAFLMSTEFTLYTLLQNLIANACAYSPNEAVIKVSVSQNEKNTVICVDDSGPGIDESERENVLKRFYRDQYQDKYKSTGSGLGLAIVGQIVTMHKGRIELDTAPIGGLRVQVMLPNLSNTE
ncbi:MULTISPECIES: ATP-binding protein [unclassified Alteromonas]|uniref:ATP-binding protein n=1 Tax=unclassified Alteromonas TaxID=2614992 RepID=UPI001F2844BD|nr:MULTISPECIES: ATP-binding protein [unclassified Alteromonas]